MVLSPLGDAAVVLSLGGEVDATILARVGALSAALRAAGGPGIVDVVPAFATVTVFYDIARTGRYDAFERRLAELADRALEALPRAPAARQVEIPVCYGGEYGPDLEAVALRAGVGLEAVIESHSAAEYRVDAIGFVPGFAYLEGLPARLHTPRRPTPRPHVPAGSVGIGGAQTGVYPIETPGGWNLIGRTPVALFDLGRSEPSRLRVGDEVRFRPMTPEEFAAWK